MWLRSQPVNKAKVIVKKTSPTIEVAKEELETYYNGESVTLKLDGKMPDDDGYRIDGTTITARRDAGLLYGAFALLRMQQTSTISHQPSAIDESHPAFSLRLLNHWDNLDGSIERGYAGESIFEWFKLDEQLIREYARANASIGINGSVLNNVNASPKTRELKPGESQTLTMTIPVRDLASFDEAGSQWLTEAGTYTFRLGFSSRDIKASPSQMH